MPCGLVCSAQVILQYRLPNIAKLEQLQSAKLPLLPISSAETKECFCSRLDRKFCD